MRLHKLQIAGFKSFSERAEMAFDTGVTAIVGPNGCGKSNVADAIVWVLGEQSAKSLRGDQMQDVIFNGSEARKPTAAAEVRLMLSGVTSTSRPVPEGEESVMARDVEVTRRLYRSGDSEYLINGEACRLRDVHELLMDTGLGAKAYAIIEQGKIGQILSTRPADRRQLIEEAAGVTKYKARRHAAELKLEASQQNLTRIDDIVFEVEKQRAALRRQAAKARRYRRLREELRRWEKVMFARRYRVLAAAIEEARGRLAARRADEAAASARLAAADETLARVRLELAQAEARAGALRESAHGRELEIDRRQNSISLGRQQVDQLVARSADIAEELTAIEARRGPASRAVADRNAALSQAVSERDEAAAVLGRANDEWEASREALDALEADLDQRRQHVYLAQSTIASLEHSVESARAAGERVAAELARLKAEQADVETEDWRLREERASVAEQVAAVASALERVRADGEAKQAALADAREEQEAQRRDTRLAEQEVAGVEARLASLEELESARAQYGEAARLVLSEEGGIAHRGSLADYLEVERGFEPAVEGFLGDLLQHVIVDAHDAAEHGLALVRERRAGRCGFIVGGGGQSASESAPAPVPAPDPAPPSEGLVPLASLVRVTGGPAALITRILRDAWVAPSFQKAKETAALTSRPVVTIDGDVFTGPHLVYGGGREEARGILTTKGEIRELRARAVNTRARLDSLASRGEEVDAVIAGLTGVIADLALEAHRHEKSIVGLEAQLGKIDENRGRLSRRAGLIGTEEARAAEQRRALEEREREARTEIEKKSAERTDAESRLAGGQRELQRARDEVEALGRRVADARAAHAGLMERASALRAEVARLDEAVIELASRFAARQHESQQNVARQTSLKEAIEESERLLDRDVQELERLRAQVREADEELVRLRSAADDREGDIRAARSDLDTVRAEVAEIDVSRVAAESDLGHLAATCLESVDTPLDDVLAEVDRSELEGPSAPSPIVAEGGDAEEPEEEAEAAGGQEAAGESDVLAQKAAPTSPEGAIAALKARIERLGPVNMMAIEQFDELEGRHVFLTAQRQDLRESIAATTEAIRKIDETSKARFRDAFAVINENFQETFAVLFGGGRAGLALMDEADVLESGVEIVAQPPGKRLQNVQLLSGGEKALTAIALMFAIFRYKPSPFCVLDEIDAPLDDANIGRFVEILRQMQDQTQFIIITHSRKTMEIADRLYGVTMEEPGVSKLISVRLN